MNRSFVDFANFISNDYIVKYFLRISALEREIESKKIKALIMLEQVCCKKWQKVVPDQLVTGLWSRGPLKDPKDS